jgi:uncharacterized protein (TIGR02594 family)
MRFYNRRVAGNNRIAIALGCVGLMLACLPMISRHSQGNNPATLSVPAAGPHIKPLAINTATPAQVAVARLESVPAASANPAGTGEFVTASKPTVVVPLPHARPQEIATRREPVPLPQPRPQKIAQSQTTRPTEVAEALPPGAVAHLPLPQARPQNIAVAAPPSPAQPADVVDASNTVSGAIVQPPLPQPRPMVIAAARDVIKDITAPMPEARPQTVAAVAPANMAKPVPMPKARPQALAAVMKDIAPALPKARPQDVAATSKLPAVAQQTAAVETSVDQDAPIQLASLPVSFETEPNALLPIFAPVPKVRPSYIDRYLLVAEMRKYLGTNPTKWRSVWCAVYMNMVLHKLGYKGTDSAAARSFADYGKRIHGPKVGAIAVLSRGSNGGHVGVVQGVDRHGNPIIVSGNHGHRVGVGTYPRSRVIAYVVPTRADFRRGHRAPARAQHTSAATTQLAARRSEPAPHAPSVPSPGSFSAIPSEYRNERQGTASLRSRARHGRFQSAFAEYRGNEY